MTLFFYFSNCLKSPYRSSRLYYQFRFIYSCGIEECINKIIFIIYIASYFVFNFFSGKKAFHSIHLHGLHLNQGLLCSVHFIDGVSSTGFSVLLLVSRAVAMTAHVWSTQPKRWPPPGHSRPVLCRVSMSSLSTPHGQIATRSRKLSHLPMLRWPVTSSTSSLVEFNF